MHQIYLNSVNNSPLTRFDEWFEQNCQTNMQHFSVASIYIECPVMYWEMHEIHVPPFFESSPAPVVKYALKCHHCRYKNFLSSGKCCAIHNNLWKHLVGFQYYRQDSLEDTSILPWKSQKHGLLLPLLKIKACRNCSVPGINSNY